MNNTRVKLIVFHTVKPEWGLVTNKMISAIKIWTRSEYYHTELLIDDILITSYIQEGVIFKKVDIHKYLEDKNTLADIFNIDIPHENIIPMLNFANSQKGKPYDWRGIFLSQFLPMRKENPNNWFCSEINTKVLQIGEPDPNKLPHHASEYAPCELLKVYKS